MGTKNQTLESRSVLIHPTLRVQISSLPERGSVRIQIHAQFDQFPSASLLCINMYRRCEAESIIMYFIVLKDAYITCITEKIVCVMHDSMSKLLMKLRDDSLPVSIYVLHFKLRNTIARQFLTQKLYSTRHAVFCLRNNYCLPNLKYKHYHQHTQCLSVLLCQHVDYRMSWLNVLVKSSITCSWFWGTYHCGPAIYTLGKMYLFPFYDCLLSPIAQIEV